MVGGLVGSQSDMPHLASWLHFESPTPPIGPANSIFAIELKLKGGRRDFFQSQGWRGAVKRPCVCWDNATSQSPVTDHNHVCLNRKEKRGNECKDVVVGHDAKLVSRMKRLRHAADPPRFASDPQLRGGSEACRMGCCPNHGGGDGLERRAAIQPPDEPRQPGKFAAWVRRVITRIEMHCGRIHGRRMPPKPGGHYGGDGMKWAKWAGDATGAKLGGTLCCLVSAKSPRKHVSLVNCFPPCLPAAPWPSDAAPRFFFGPAPPCLRPGVANDAPLTSRRRHSVWLPFGRRLGARFHTVCYGSPLLAVLLALNLNLSSNSLARAG